MRRKNYLWYQFWRHAIVGNGLKVFYKKMQLTGREDLPKDKPLLFVPNHQNSFMDAFLVTTNLKQVMYFLTRAKAFNPPIMGWFLRSLNMLPVYRVRDGFSSVQKNNAIFDLCYDYLNNQDSVLVFAEANHNLKRRIRPLSKGFTRIAFGAEEKYGWDLDMQIVPVGVNYSSHREGRNHVHIKFGECIPVSKFKEAFVEDENEASMQMKEEVSDAMKKLVFHVEDLEEYSVHKILWDELEPDDTIITNPDISNARIQKTSAHLTPELIEEAKELDKLADTHNISLKHVGLGKQVGAKDILLSPFHFFSFVNNLIPYQPIKYLISKVIKDHAFDASIKYISALFLLPIFYAIVASVLAIAGVNSMYIYAYLALSVLTAPLFTRAKELFTKNSAQQIEESKPTVFQEIKSRLEAFKELRKTILNE
ncbi:lysophospholipid acyltransferase family protein [Gracilimonas sp.]|uniref:lysophospholipid acyltransferase family protein n=1 Tax=Gracilimonas sp. TaxID=1974203 RepID=UPI0032EB7A66